MKTYNTLIKLSKRQLDELKKAQGALEEQKAQLLQALEHLRNELERETMLAAKQVEMASFFGEFAKRLRAREEELRAEIRAVEAEIDKLAEEIMVAYTDLKKYEIAKDNAMKRAKAEADRKETIMMDEIAGQQFLRKMKEEM